jgi:tRNA threonylcarbamoyladenosine biosynthesis protein TsaB
MRILLIDTCGATGSVAVADTAREPAIVAFATLPGRTASERLLPTIKQLAASAEISLQAAAPQSKAGWQPLEAVVVVHGPGSFTGVRVGLSAAKGLCEALNLPLIAISRLSLLASRVERSLATPVRALLDAGRGEFYSGVYAEGGCNREALLTRDQLLNETICAAASEAVAHETVVTCESAVAAAVATLAPQLVAEPTAADALPLAVDRILRRTFDDAATIDANYMRRSDAEIFAKPISLVGLATDILVSTCVDNPAETPE